jgi:hypothetical protein
VHTYHVVGHLCQRCHTSAGAVGVWRPEICRDEAQDTGERFLVLEDLVDPIVMRNFVEVGMTPGMAANLMAGRQHPLQDRSICTARYSTIPTRADEEEGRLDLVGVEGVEHLGCELTRPIVEGQRDLALDGAFCDIDAVRDLAEPRPRQVSTFQNPSPYCLTMAM